MLGPLLFLSLNISANLIKKKVTDYSWIADSLKPYSGKCYEYDVETGGKQYQAVTSKSKCRPEKTKFLWIPSDRGVGGKCYEVDEKTEGMGFARGTSQSNCVTENVSYSWELTSEISGECYQIDGKLKRKVSKSKCATKSVDHHWLPRESGWGGKCYAVDTVQGAAGYIESVNADLCKPSRTTFLLKMKKEGDQGYCYEIAIDGGAKSFSKRVSREKCFSDPSVEFVWEKDSSGIGGTCLEFRKSVNSKVSSRKVNYKKCINFKTNILFKRLGKIEGVCLLIDSMSGGEKFSVSIPKRSCRNIPKELQFSIMANELGRPICVESDKKTGGDLFISKVSNTKCEESNIKPKWVLNEDSWSGKCIEVRTIGSLQREKTINKEACRPSQVRVLWHNFSKLNGKCFEVDEKLGTVGFVQEVSLKKCAPKFTKYVFYRKKGQNAGHCYLVDRETSGEKFNKVGSYKKCKRNLIKVLVD